MMTTAGNLYLNSSVDRSRLQCQRLALLPIFGGGGTGRERDAEPSRVTLPPDFCEIHMVSIAHKHELGRNVGISIRCNIGSNGNIELALMIAHNQNASLIGRLRRSGGHLEDIVAGRECPVADNELERHRRFESDFSASLRVGWCSGNSERRDQQCN